MGNITKKNTIYGVDPLILLYKIVDYENMREILLLQVLL